MHLSTWGACGKVGGLVIASKHGRFSNYHQGDERGADLLILAESLLTDVALGIYECTRYNLVREDL
jgi:hypothetical protein